MKKIYFLILLSCAYFGSMLAQDNKAPNYFQASSKIFKHRLKSFGEHTYHYDENNRLLSVTNEDLSDAEAYEYDAQGYMNKKSEHKNGKLYSETTFNRNQQGYVTLSSFYYDFRGMDNGLEEYIRIAYKYDNNNFLTSAVVEVRDADTDRWVLAHTVTLEYNKANQLAKFTRIDNQGKVVSTEEINYNEKGKIISNNYTNYADPDNVKTTEWQYQYDENGNITSAGREGFMRTNTYDTSMLMKETFIPRETVHALIYFGPRNVITGSLKTPFVPVEYGSEHAPLSTKKSSGETKASYEDVAEETAVNKIAKEKICVYPSIVKDALHIDASTYDLGKKVYIYTLGGELLRTEVLKNTNQCISITLPCGRYILKIGKEIHHFQVQ